MIEIAEMLFPGQNITRTQGLVDIPPRVVELPSERVIEVVETPASPEDPAPHQQDFNVDSKIGSKLAKTPKSRDKSRKAGNKGGSRRELVRYQPTEPVSRYEELGETSSSTHGPYDQFEENKRRFGTQSTYDFNKYTTVLDESKITPELRAQVEELAGEIGSRDGLRDGRYENEEAEFANVLRPEEAAKQLKSVLLSTIGATANGTAQ